MRSGTSFFDGTVFKKTVFRFWPLWGVYFAGWLMALPLSGLMALRTDSYGWTGFGNSMRYFSFNRVPAMGEMALQAEVIFGVLAAMAVFSHLYSARSANLFGSLPVRREGLFLTHYLAGLIFLTVPNVIVFLLTLAVEAAGGCVCMEGLWFWLATVCGEGFFFYTLAVFCAMFTGHLLAMPAFYAIVNVFVLFVTQMVELVFNAFYYGFTGFPRWVRTAAEWLTPAVKLSGTVSSWAYENEEGALVLEIKGLGTVGIFSLAAVALAVCAFFLYRARRLESAGDVVAVNRMKPVFKYGVALCAGLAFGIGTMAVIGGGEVTLMVSIVIWAVIGYFAAEMLLQKSFKVFKKWKGALAVAAVFVILFCVVGFDLTGFETRVPDPDSVDSVEISGLSLMYLDDNGDHFAGTVTDPEVIRLITLLHETAVGQEDADWNTETASGGAATSLIVTYHLKNGGSLSRGYYTMWVRPAEVEQEGTGAWAVQQIYNNKELCWQMYGFDQLEAYLAKGGRLSEVEYGSYDAEAYNDAGGWTYAYYYGGDAEALLAAVKEDFFAGRIGARRVVRDKWDGYGAENQGYLRFSSDGRDKDGYYYIRITLTGTATGTLAALEERADRAEVVQNGAWYDGEYPVEIVTGLDTMFAG